MSDTATISAPGAPATAKARFADYLELTKPRLSLLSVLTTLVGWFAARPAWDAERFGLLLLGTGACAGGVAALNQWMERDTDARMHRTADRPIPAGKITGGSAFVLGWLLCIGGLVALFRLGGPLVVTPGQFHVPVERLAALFALLTIVSYLACYTPAKRHSRWSVELGAVAGAFPPLIGWAAATNGVGPLGWVLFGILFFWQIPHFMAVAWTHRGDYARVNFPFLPVRDAEGGRVARWALLNTFALVVVSTLPAFLHEAGRPVAGKCYLGATLLLGAWFTLRALAFLRPDTRDAAARKLFLASILWLPLQLAALVADRLFF
ncbi:MAG: heme o synthase [Verrucomicrobiota bacterium]